MALERTPVDEVWGVGQRYAEMLERQGITNALELRNAPDEFIRDRMTVVGLRTVHELRGIRCHPLELTAATRKSVMVSRSFGSAVETLPELKSAVAFYVARAAEKLRREQLVAGSLNVFISTNRFNHEPQYSNGMTMNLAPMSDNNFELTALALHGLTTIFQSGYRYKRAGVLLANLMPSVNLTKRLWDDEENERMRKLMATLDELNDKFGRDAIKCGMFSLHGKWRTRFSKRSPRYTTKWNELMTVT